MQEYYLFRQQNLDLMDKKEITELGGEEVGADMGVAGQGGEGGKNTLGEILKE